MELVGTALPDIRTIDTVERSEDRHRYLVVEYENGARVPSWLVSDGSLRLMALTILAYVDKPDGVLLIEEPENGIHPKAIETAMQSPGSVYDSQVLTATHSPVALNMLEAREILCFAKDASGATDIVSGDEHPKLRERRRDKPDLGALFASGILSGRSASLGEGSDHSGGGQDHGAGTSVRAAASRGNGHSPRDGRLSHSPGARWRRAYGRGGAASTRAQGVRSRDARARPGRLRCIRDSVGAGGGIE